MKNYFLIILSLSSGLSACTSLDFGRSDSSGYTNRDQNYDSVKSYYLEKKSKAWVTARDQIGLAPKAEYSEQELDAIRARLEVNKAESRLQYEVEKKQYYSLKPYFRNDWERAYFLKLPSREARERWALSKGIRTDETQFDPMTNNLIENSDIAKGMTKGAVKQSWGEPESVETAGNSLYGNERWRYSKLISTEEGYKHETRIIYFEAGRVVGWETL